MHNTLYYIRVFNGWGGSAKVEVEGEDVDDMCFIVSNKELKRVNAAEGVNSPVIFEKTTGLNVFRKVKRTSKDKIISEYNRVYKELIPDRLTHCKDKQLEFERLSVVKEDSHNA